MLATFAMRALVCRDVAARSEVVGPEAGVEDLGHEAAVGVVPAGDAGAVTAVECILKDGLMGVEELPAVLNRIV